MSYAGLGLGGTFAPDSYLTSTGKADTLGAPLTAAELAAYQKTYGTDAANKIAAVCNQSASPRDCMGQFFLKDAYLGRTGKGDWITFINGKLASPLPAPMAMLPPPAPAADNTMLYVGGAIVAAVVVGGVVLATGKKKGRR